MKKSDVYANPKLAFLKELPENQQAVVLASSKVEGGLETLRDIDEDKTVRLHDFLEGIGYGTIPGNFFNQRVVLLTEALSALVRRHPHTGEPIPPGDIFSTEHLSDSDFLLYWFAIESGRLNRQVDQLMLGYYLQTLKSNDSFWQQVKQALNAAEVVSSIRNTDREALARARENMWWKASSKSDSTSSKTYSTGGLDDNSLAGKLAKYFDGEEIRTMCFVLGVEYDNLAGETKNAKVRELLKYLQRHGGMERLIAYCSRERSNVAWP